ncbi:PE family protein [Mycobacterium kansasii 824]|nr:PE family protein [Mycobacterium kansasii 824]
MVPEGLAAASAAVDALTARLAAAHAAAIPAITAVVPPAADPVSLETAAAFSAVGCEHVAVAAEGVEELGRSGPVLLSLVSVTRLVMLQRRRRTSFRVVCD